MWKLLRSVGSKLSIFILFYLTLEATEQNTTQSNVARRHLCDLSITNNNNTIPHLDIHEHKRNEYNCKRIIKQIKIGLS